MGPPTMPQNPIGIAIAAASMAAAVKLLLIWSGWPESHVLADDAFYYFTIARNLADGLGPTFDGLAPTNGFHPLWQFLLVPIWWVPTTDLWIPVRMALTVTLVLDLASGGLIHRLVSRYADARTAALATTLWFLSPLTFFLGLRGMEASVSTLAILLVFLALPRDGATLRRSTVLGLAVGLAGLARTDNLVSVGLAVAVTLLLPGAGRDVASRIRGLVVTGSTALAVMLPWFTWCVVEFGHVIQVSGRVKAVTTKIAGRLPHDWSDLDTWAHATMAPLVTVVRFLSAEEFRKTGGGWYPWLALAAVAFSLVLLAGAATTWRRHRWLTFPIVAVVLHTLLFGLVWRSYATWYALAPMALLTIVFATTLARGDGAWAWLQRGAAVGLGGVALVLLLRFTTVLPHEPRGPQTRFEPFLARCAAALPQGGNVGAFDAGAPGYVSALFPGLRVVNLDCLVNNVAFDAVQDGTYADYVASTVNVFIQRHQRTRMFLTQAEYERMKGLMGLD